MSEAYAKVEAISEDKAAGIISEEMKNQLGEALTLKQDKVEAIFKQRADQQDAQNRSFEQ